MSTIDDVKSRIDIVDLVSEAGVKLRRSGRSYTGFCPFHSNTRTPAFVVWPESGTWRCFGECNEGGDVFKFVMKHEGVDFKEALTRLAARAGVELEQFTPRQQEQREANDHLRALLEEAVTFYRHHLLQTRAGEQVLAYLREKRGLSAETLETFGLGYAPLGWDTAIKHFTAKGYSTQDLADSGLLSERSSDEPQASSFQSRYFDRFRHRIMIPIRDADGRMAGFGARVVDPDDIPKFLNSPETPVFSKGRLLYGLDRARKPIRAADQAVIVEGYLDVIALHQASYENVVSPMGTALTEDQLRLLKRFSRRIVLALDPDAAGQKAILRGLDTARAALDHQTELVFDAHGLLRHEARLQADLRVATLPEGLDPDEIVQRDSDEWFRVVGAARPVVEHVMDTLLKGQPTSDPKVKADIVRQMLPLIDDLPTPVERDTYRQMLARRLRVDERTLTGASSTPRASRGRGRPAQRRAEETGAGGDGISAKNQQAEAAGALVAASLPASPSRLIEATVLAILLSRPELLPRLDRDLQESGLTALASSDFGYTDHQAILRLVRQAQEQDASETPHYVLENLDAQMRELFDELSAHKLDNSRPEKLSGELFGQVLRLRRLVLIESIDQLRFLEEEARQRGEPMAEYKELLLQHDRYARSLNYVNEARKKLNQYR
jgi:DNA primase